MSIYIFLSDSKGPDNRKVTEKSMPRYLPRLIMTFFMRKTKIKKDMLNFYIGKGIILLERKLDSKAKLTVICVLLFLQIGIIPLALYPLDTRDTIKDVSELSTQDLDQDENVFLGVKI